MKYILSVFLVVMLLMSTNGFRGKSKLEDSFLQLQTKLGGEAYNKCVDDCMKKGDVAALTLMSILIRLLTYNSSHKL